MSSSANISSSGSSLFSPQPKEESYTPPYQIIQPRPNFRSRLARIDTSHKPEDETSGFVTVGSYIREELVIQIINKYKDTIYDVLKEAVHENENAFKAVKDFVKEKIADRLFTLFMDQGCIYKMARAHAETNKDLDREIDVQLLLKRIFTTED